MPKQRGKSLEELECEIASLQKHLQERQTLMKARETLNEVETRIIETKHAILEKEKEISMKQAEKRGLLIELRKKQALRRQQSRYTNQVEEAYLAMERKLARKQRELENRFNPSSRKLG